MKTPIAGYLAGYMKKTAEPIPAATPAPTTTAPVKKNPTGINNPEVWKALTKHVAPIVDPKGAAKKPVTKSPMVSSRSSVK